MTPEHINDILTAIVQGILIPVIAVLGAAAVRFISEKLKSTRAKRILEQAADAAQAAVAQVAQSFVDDLKKAGAWDAEAGKEAARRALDLAKTLLGDFAYATLQDIVGEAEEYLKAKIEQAVRFDPN